MAYSFGNFRLAINDPRYFFGRGELISEVVRSPFEVRVLLGGRRLGKTSVLNAIRWSLLAIDGQAQNRALPVLVNLQQEQPRSLDNFRYLLIERLQQTIQNPKQEAGLGFDLRQTYRRFLRQIAGGGVSLLGIKLNVTNPAQEQQLIHEEFSQDLRNIIKELHQQDCQGVCFIFDGAEYLVKQEWVNDAWSYLRSLKDTTNTAIQPFLGLFLSGYRDLKDYHQEIGSLLFNIAEVKWLTTLNPSETKDLIAHRCQDEKLNPTKKLINPVIDWAGCHPYLTHQMLNAIFDNIHREERLSGKHLLHDLIRQHRKRDFSAWWDEEERSYGFGEKEQTVYLALIQERKGTAESLAEKVGLSPGDTEDALEVLAGTGVIRQLDYETYVIGARLFEKWVKEEKEVQRCKQADLEVRLKLLYEKLSEFERKLSVTGSFAAKLELKQGIKREILPNLRRYEAEYWELCPTEAIVISDEQAEPQLVQVEQAVKSIERIPEYPPQLIPLLQEIRGKLEDLDKAASAKLKVVLPLIPAIASYELEMDTEGVMYKTWKAIKGLVRR